MIQYEDLALSNAEFMDEVIVEVSKTLLSGRYILGEQVAKFENNFAEYHGVKHCIGVGNGLDALTLSIKALELPQNSEIIVASNTYIATILAIINAGYKPVLVEPLLGTYNIDGNKILKEINAETAAIIVTHLYGKPCDMTKIMKIAAHYELEVIEDCAQSHGAMHAGKLTGTFGIAGCFSFYPTKNLGAMGDAGAILSNNDEFSEKIRYLRNYGSRYKYENKYIGFNSRMDEVQAAVLNVKLKYLDKITEKKRVLADLYSKNLGEKLIKPEISMVDFDVFHIYPVRTSRRDQLRKYLELNSVLTEIHYPIAPNKQKAFDGIFKKDFPIADEIHKTILSLPISYGTTVDQVLEISSLINKIDL